MMVEENQSEYPKRNSSAASAINRAFFPKIRKYQPPPGDCWDDDHVQEVVDLWSLSPEDEKKLLDLRRRVADIDHFKNDPHILIRFMTTPAGHGVAEENFRRMINWRRDNNLDSILEWYKPPQLLLDFTPSGMLYDYDHDGDPIYVERGGAIDCVGLLKIFDRGEIMRYTMWTRELNTNGAWINDYEQRQGRKIKGITIIYDLKGLCSRHLNHKVLDLFRDITKLTATYYPGPIKKMIIIRAPAIFRVIWSVAKHIFHATSREKMIFSGNHDYLEILDQFMDRNVLPPCIYDKGRGKLAVGMMQRLDGGMVPLDKVNGDLSPYQSTAETDDLSICSSSDAFNVDQTADESATKHRATEGSSSPHESNDGLVRVMCKPITCGHWKGNPDQSNVVVDRWAVLED